MTSVCNYSFMTHESFFPRFFLGNELLETDHILLAYSLKQF